MSLIINLLKDEEEVPVEVFPDEDFTAVLQKASILVGYEIDISSLIGEDEVSMTDSVYEYFMKQESLLTMQDQLESDSNVLEYLNDDVDTLNQYPDQNTTIVAGDDEKEEDCENVIKIIELSENEDYDEPEIKPLIKSEAMDYIPTLNEENAFLNTVNQFEEYFSNEKVPNVNRIIETIVKNRVTCHFCNIRVSNMKDPKRNYIFDEKNQVYFNKNLIENITMNAKLICSKCLGNNFKKLGKSVDKNLVKDEYIVVTDGLKLIYKALPDEETFKNRRKSKIVVRQDPNDQFMEDSTISKNNTMTKKKRGRKKIDDTSNDNTNFVVRRKLTKDITDSDLELNKKSSVIKRKLEMDGTISEIFISADGSNADEVCSPSKKMSKVSSENELICRSCGLQFEDLASVVEHGHVHQVHNRINGIPCGLCLRSFKSFSILKRHVFGEHQLSQSDSTKLAQTKEQLKRILEGDYDDKESTLIEVKPEIVTRCSKKEEQSEENEEEDLTDRLHKYLSGEMDADTFFQQEYYKSDPDSQLIPDEDDDDLEVWIVQAENPDEAEDGESITDDANVEELTITAEDEPEDDGDELAFLNATDNVTTEIVENIENIDTNIVEEFQEVDYFEDPEYDPENNDDNESVKSKDEKRPKKRWSTQAKHKCEICNKSYTTQSRLEQHKCHPSGNSEDKKDDLTCSICKENFLSKVRLQFHRQTHREGGWQHMSCDQCGRRDFASEHELFDHIYFSHKKPYTCPFDGCIKTFKLKKLLKTHVRDHGLKKYVCNICNQRFQVHQTLKEHMVLHLKVKPFQCHICHKYMSKASRLRMHLLVHTSQQNPAHILVCKICDSAFKDVTEAEAHCENSYDCEPKEDDKDGVYDEDMYEEMGIQILSPTRYYNDDEDVKSSWRKTDVLPKKDIEGNNEGPTLSNKHSLLMQLSDVARKTVTAVWIDKVFCCQYCEKVYYTKEALHQHRYIHNGVPEPYQCHLCEARFLTYARCTAHKSTHGYFKEGGAPSLRDFPVVKHYLCDLCDKSNLLWTTVSVHFRHHHKYNINRRLPPPCKNCCTQYNTSWELGKHRRIKHRKEVHAAAKAPIKVVNYSYKCMQCDQQLPNRAALTSHRKALHGDDDPGRKSNKTTGLLVCSECGKTYATKPALLTHIKWHTEHGVGIEAARRRKRAFGKGNHICSTCGLGFYSAANLRAHIDRIHEKSYKYTCEECGKGHFTHVEMETHKLTHTGERPFKCPDCPRAYVTKAILNKHYRNHTGERPYSCDLCGATFKTAHSRNYHKIKHENGKLPAPLIVLEVKGGNSKALQAALHDSFQVMGDKKEGRSVKQYSEDGDSIKEEIEEFHQEVNEEEVLVRTSEMDDSDDNIITVQEESPDGVHIVYKRIVRGLDENGCENEYTIEYEEVQ
ncbi:uncharacterized protein LOC143910163 isoform X2 [Arctopsyche grandis]|uniref:uncharacterized protein LOC143910163 isoform X2 n=1 Tax=Arctopsyche grandis TaxID=121162 RepID=UPI00406D6535